MPVDTRWIDTKYSYTNPVTGGTVGVIIYIARSYGIVTEDEVEVALAPLIPRDNMSVILISDTRGGVQSPPLKKLGEIAAKSNHATLAFFGLHSNRFLCFLSSTLSTMQTVLSRQELKPFSSNVMTLESFQGDFLARYGSANILSEENIEEVMEFMKQEMFA